MAYIDFVYYGPVYFYASVGISACRNGYKFNRNRGSRGFKYQVKPIDCPACRIIGCREIIEAAVG